MKAARITITAMVAAAIMMPQIATAACIALTPAGPAGVTNIRSGPTLDDPIVDTLTSHGPGNPYGRLFYCGVWQYDRNGHTRNDDSRIIQWLKVQYRVNSDPTHTHWGWISSVVAGIAP
jgi:hypothetical protein